MKKFIYILLLLPLFVKAQQTANYIPPGTPSTSISAYMVGTKTDSVNRRLILYYGTNSSDRIPSWFQMTSYVATHGGSGGTYTPGYGLALTGTQFKIDTASHPLDYRYFPNGVVTTTGLDRRGLSWSANTDFANIYFDSNSGTSAGRSRLTFRAGDDLIYDGFNFLLYDLLSNTTTNLLKLTNDTLQYKSQDIITAGRIGSGLTYSGGVLTAIGGGGGGTVTGGSIGWPGTIYTSPTTATISGGVLTFSPVLATQTAHTFLSGAISGTTTPTFRAIDATDIPTLNQNTTGNAATVTTIPTLSGDVTNSANAVTLNTVNSNVGTFGSATQVPQVTVDAKGRVTGVSNVTITTGTTTNPLTFGTGLVSGTFNGSSAVTAKVDTTVMATVLNQFPKNDTRYVKLTRQIINGNGIQGGGTLATDRTIAVDTTVIGSKAYDNATFVHIGIPKEAIAGKVMTSTFQVRNTVPTRELVNSTDTTQKYHEDRTGNTYTATNKTVPVAGLGNAIHFNSNSQYFTGTDAGFPAGSSSGGFQISILAVIRCSSTAGQRTLYYSNAGNSGGLSVILSTGNLSIFNNGVAIVNLTVPNYGDGLPHWVMLTLNGTAGAWYDNGSITNFSLPAYTITNGGTFNNNGYYYTGNNVSYFNGDLDQYVIYPTALSSAQELAIWNGGNGTATLPNGYVARYDIDEGFGSTSLINTGSLGTANNLSLVGTPTYLGAGNGFVPTASGTATSLRSIITHSNGASAGAGAELVLADIATATTISGIHVSFQNSAGMRPIVMTPAALIFNPTNTSQTPSDLSYNGIGMTGGHGEGGTTSGLISFVPQANSGTYSWLWPTTAGTAGQALVTNGGASAMTWGTFAPVRTSVVVAANQTIALNYDYLNPSATQYTLTLPTTTGFATDGSKIVTVLCTGTGGAKILVPSGYAMQSGSAQATTTGTGGVTLTQGQKVQVIAVGTNSFYLQPLNGTVTLY